MKKYLLLTLFFMFLKAGFSQVPFFITPPNVYITESGYGGNCIQSLASSPTSSHQVANGFWDETYDLRFYVINDSIFNRSAGFLSLINGYTTPIDEYDEEEFFLPWSTGMNEDVVIIPKPGVCKHLYAIYSVPGIDNDEGWGNYGAVLFTEVDISSGTPSVVSLSSATGASPNALVNLGTFSGAYNAGVVAGSEVALAASRPYDSNNDRVLYAVNGYGQAYSVLVTSSGFGTPYPVQGTAIGLTPAYIAQAKLRSDGQMLAYAVSGSTGGKLYQQPVFESGTYVGENNGSPNLYTLPTGVTEVNGIEFLDGSDDAMILATNNGIYSFYVSGTTGIFTQVYMGNYNTQIDYCQSGYFYLANNSGVLKKVANTFTAGVPGFTMTDANNAGYPALTIYSDASLEDHVAEGIYSLPNEVDGDDYAYFTGVDQTTCNFQINSINPTSVCADIQQVYNCNPITLTNLSAGAESYTLTVNSINTSCGTVSGSGYLTYNSGTITTLPTDLRSMPGTNGTWLNSHTGSYIVTLTANNACGDNSTVSTYINVNASPGATAAVVGLNNPNTGIPCTTSSQGSPCTLCSGSPTMNISSSTGTISYYSKDVYEYVSGVWTLVYSDDNIATSGVSALTSIYVGCNGPDVSCSPSIAWTVGAEYYVNVTVGNVCGSNSAIAYFQFEDCKWGGSTAITNLDDISSFTTYPNPFNDKVDFQLTLTTGTQISIKLLDMTGRLVNELAPKYYNTGEHLTTIDTRDLSTGVYIYQLIADDKTYTGKLVKTQ